MYYSEQVDERLIWLKFQAGDEQAYSYIYTAYFKKLFSFGLKIKPDPGLVKDCIQELFIKLWRLKENLGQPVSLKHYLYQSLRRTIFKEIAKQQYKLQVDLKDDYHFEVVLAYDLQLINLQISEARQKQLEQALKKLTKRQRDAIHLKFYGKLSYEEIAEVMEVQVKSVYNLISKALELLYQDMNRDNSLTVLAFLQLLTATYYY